MVSIIGSHVLSLLPITRMWTFSFLNCFFFLFLQCQTSKNIQITFLINARPFGNNHIVDEKNTRSAFCPLFNVGLKNRNWNQEITRLRVMSLEIQDKKAFAYFYFRINLVVFTKCHTFRRKWPYKPVYAKLYKGLASLQKLFWATSLFIVFIYRSFEDVVKCPVFNDHHRRLIFNLNGKKIRY